MGLNELWFILFVVIIAGYLIVDGFDMGVGILHLFVGRTDVERRLTLVTTTFVVCLVGGFVVVRYLL